MWSSTCTWQINYSCTAGYWSNCRVFCQLQVFTRPSERWILDWTNCLEGGLDLCDHDIQFPDTTTVYPTGTPLDPGMQYKVRLGVGVHDPHFVANCLGSPPTVFAQYDFTCPVEPPRPPD
jgi:hypothetical protein